MISFTDSRVLDRNSEALGVPVSVLMDRAGAALAGYIEKEYPGCRAVFVCGTGNNGGDGFAAALRMDPKKIKVVLLKKPSEIRSDIARERYSLLECPIEIYGGKESFEGCDLIVDCALGTGISGNIREPYLQFINDAKNSGLPVVSADIPSGFGTETAVVPEATVTFHDVKTGMTEANCGKIIVVDIGIPDEASSAVGPGDMLRYPVPRRDSHKGNNGKLMIIGGGPYFGAPAMSALSALRTGADSVRIFAPYPVCKEIASVSPVFMVTKLPDAALSLDSLDILLKEMPRYDAVLIGPGLGNAEETLKTARAFVRACSVPVVIDADGISAVKDLKMKVPAVLTPHSGEFAGIADGRTPEELSLAMNAVILKKGPEDIIAGGGKTRVSRTGNPGMTGAGTGDVLAGAVAGLLSKGMSAFDAACLGAYITGKAGDKAFSEKSYGLIATDVIERIPDVLREGL
ncbi:MAG: NAD(P)H-hydrate dehydratase [Candidatus Methanomethylophilaceae archaeon]|nr:NAD(P)H-hydrate dehydratase [Candidatus Methanomethylophilaceae archaeon]